MSVVSRRHARNVSGGTAAGTVCTLCCPSHRRNAGHADRKFGRLVTRAVVRKVVLNCRPAHGQPWLHDGLLCHGGGCAGPQSGSNQSVCHSRRFFGNADSGVSLRLESVKPCVRQHILPCVQIGPTCFSGARLTTLPAVLVGVLVHMHFASG